jgi:hypothetical protein
MKGGVDFATHSTFSWCHVVAEIIGHILAWPELGVYRNLSFSLRHLMDFTVLQPYSIPMILESAIVEDLSGTMGNLFRLTVILPT